MNSGKKFLGSVVRVLGCAVLSRTFIFNYIMVWHLILPHLSPFILIHVYMLTYPPLYLSMCICSLIPLYTYPYIYVLIYVIHSIPENGNGWRELHLCVLSEGFSHAMAHQGTRHSIISFFMIDWSWIDEKFGLFFLYYMLKDFSKQILDAQLIEYVKKYYETRKEFKSVACEDLRGTLVSLSSIALSRFVFFHVIQ